MRAALIPALLFFGSLFFVVHMQAVKTDIKPVARPDDADDEALWKILLKGGQYILPFVTLVAMMVNGYSPFKASYISILLLLASNIVWERRIGPELFVKSARAITHGAKSVIPIAAACAAAGIIAGTLGFTYLVLATVVAPALAELGVPMLTAHMFVFFYGCVSTITPPVALASYVAAGIANADINKVGWTAFFFGITSYILPFMFTYGPGLLMEGDGGDILLAVVSGFVGAYCIAACVVGYLNGPLRLWQRGVMAAAGIALLHQGWLTDLSGLAILLVMIFLTRAKASIHPSPRSH